MAVIPRIPRGTKLAVAIRLLAGYVLAGGVGWGVIGLASFYFSPDLSHATPWPSPAEVAQAVSDRNRTPETGHPPVVWRDVDYAEGAAAAWFPKQEAPILHEMVLAGQLPPLAERIGPEPAVLEGTEGIGRYGGSWYRLSVSNDDISGVMRTRLSYANLVRWSPNGYPIVPHLAKSWTVSPDQKVYTFTLRRGVRWSDGHPFTAEDILYWWQWEALYFKLQPAFMSINGEQGTIERIDDLQVRFVFPKPNGMFLERLASWDPSYAPSHYLKKFHPAIGDQALIRATMQSRQLPDPRSVYDRMSGLSSGMGDVFNPECPRMWPWIYQQYRATAPQSFVRNPYYFAVDPAGNQLPYLDRIVSDVKARSFIAAAATGGEVSLQDRFLEFQDYTLLASEAKRGNYQLYHWYHSSPTALTFHLNLNRLIDPHDDSTRLKHGLLNEKSFRQALSLAINRQEIIDAIYNGVGEPAQSAPGQGSPYFNEKLLHSFTAYDPARANELLGGLDLNRRDPEGFRTFPDGSRMTFFLTTTDSYPADTPQMVAGYWNKIGVRTIVQINDRNFFDTKAFSTDYDILAWPGFDGFLPLADPRDFVPTGPASFFAPAYGRWYISGGLNGAPESKLAGCFPPPPGSDIRRAMELTDQATMAPTKTGQIALFNQVLDLAAENVWTISFSTNPSQPVVVKNGFRNVPRHAIIGYSSNGPANFGIETFYWEKPADPPEIAATTKAALLNNPQSPSNAGDPARQADSPRPSAVLRYLGLGLVFALILAGLRHPFVWRRVLIMIPTLAFISVLVFTIVQLPPGDFISSKILQIEMEGNPNARAQLEDMKKTYHFDQSPLERYLYWSGLKWFTTFKPQDAGLLQGNLGRSMETNRPVAELLGDRLLLTVAISFLAVVVVWAIAIPVGIFSAVKQHTAWDYSLTFLGFLGMSIPPFLLALVLMYLSSRYLGLNISGLFSAQYGAQPYWDWPKFVNLIQRIWVPVIVLGTGGTAVMIRVMRANLLDELRKPYVTTARAKGVPPLRLLLKYPVRLAVNPFASGMGSLFPQLISGDAIVAIVLSLPTLSPLLLRALMNQDTYLSASLLMLLSLLSVLGTLFSDLLLQWLDPRVQLTGRDRNR